MVRVCHLVGESDETVSWETCMKCHIKECIIQRLTRPYRIYSPEIITADTHETRSEGEE